MKNGDISNVSSPQVICVTDVVIGLAQEEERKFLAKKSVVKLGEVDLLAANRLWKLANKYGISLELVGFESEGWTEELLNKAFEEGKLSQPTNSDYFWG